MRIAEIFRSFQGEGFLTGTESVFVRASGCNLRCWFCDTPYASWRAEGESMSVDAIVARVEQLAEMGESPATQEARSRALAGVAARNHLPAVGAVAPERIGHVVLTGGEPMLFAEVVPLSEALRRRRYHVTIETAGTVYRPAACDLMSISPKLSSSVPAGRHDAGWAARHERTRHVPDVTRRLTADWPYQVKFVIDSLDDCREVERYLAEFPEIDRARVMLMPQGTDRDGLDRKARWLRPYCESHGLIFCPRRQIEWYGLERGT